jgi:hypothetical protein
MDVHGQAAHQRVIDATGIERAEEAQEKHCFAYFHASFSVTARLNTGAPSRESTRSATK